MNIGHAIYMMVTWVVGAFRVQNPVTHHNLKSLVQIMEVCLSIINAVL